MSTCADLRGDKLTKVFLKKIFFAYQIIFFPRKLSATNQNLCGIFAILFFFPTPLVENLVNLSLGYEVRCNPNVIQRLCVKNYYRVSSKINFSKRRDHVYGSL